ncbi:hypothetical protein FKP32DRAFT_1356401 [Trametes sanguinea]|nr:hypothetical protein FKP32DRAFT_1356401 [Trametes sanguinea]
MPPACHKLVANHVATITFTSSTRVSPSTCPTRRNIILYFTGVPYVPYDGMRMTSSDAHSREYSRFFSGGDGRCTDVLYPTGNGRRSKSFQLSYVEPPRSVQMYYRCVALTYVRNPPTHSLWKAMHIISPEPRGQRPDLFIFSNPSPLYDACRHTSLHVCLLHPERDILRGWLRHPVSETPTSMPRRQRPGL